MPTASGLEVLPITRSDRRQRPRYRFSIPLNIQPSEVPAVPGMSIEISESGISAITPAELKLNDKVVLHPIAGGPIPALVRYHVGRVYGFEFLPLGPEQATKIREICKKLALYPGNHMGI